MSNLKLIRLLQEASSLGLEDLKKAMQKDKRISAIFKADFNLSKLENPEEFLTTMKYWLLNNDSVKSFVVSRHNIKNINKNILDEFRKLRVDDLTDNELTKLKDFVKTLFKEFKEVDAGSLSREARKEIDDWVNDRTKTIRSWVKNEILSVPSLRPKQKILVYRGLLFRESSLTSREKYDGTLEKGNGLKFLESIRDGSRTVDLSWDSESSWTTSKDIAESFAKYGPAGSQTEAMFSWLGRMNAGRAIDGALGYVISTWADPDDILLEVSRYRPTTHHIHGGEAEVILLPGSYLARVVKKFTVEGEVDPVNPNASEYVTRLQAAIEKIKELNTSDLIPSGLEDLDHFTAVSIMRLIKDKSQFKKLLLGGTTTQLTHSLDLLIKFYKTSLSDLTISDLQPDHFSGNPKLRKDAEAVKTVIKHFNMNVRHSSLQDKNNSRGDGKLIDLTAEQYRQTLGNFEIYDLEKSLLKDSRITTRRGATDFADICKGLGIEIRGSSRFHLLGAAKQAPIISEFLEKFFKYVGLDQPADRIAAISTVINLLKRALRNAKFVLLIKDILTNFEAVK